MKQCPYCKSPMDDRSLYCGRCGRPYPQKALNNRNTGYLKYVIAAVIAAAILGLAAVGGAAWWFFNKKKSNVPLEASTIEAERSEGQEKICTIEDIVEFMDLTQGCSGLTVEAKSNYQKARPYIEAIAKRYGFTIYEYHYVNGDLGQGEMSSYCCYLYKNCTISKDETGYPTFTPTNKGIGCILSYGEITLYDRDSYDELIRQIKERCENKLYSEIEGDGEEAYYYTDGKYCYYTDCIVSGEYRIPIHKQIDENNGATETNDLDWLQGHWVYEQGSYKGHFIIQGDKLIQYSSMHPDRDEATFTIDGDVLRARFSANDNIVVKIDFANQRIDYGEGQWMHKIDSTSGNDYPSNSSSTTSSSSRTFQSEQLVIGYLANQSFRASDGLTMRIDGSGRLYVDGDYAGVLSVLRYNSTSALLRYGGGMYGEGKIRVDIVGNKFSLTDPEDGTVYYQR